MSAWELSVSCQPVSPATTATVASKPNHKVQPGSPFRPPDMSRGQLAGTTRKPMTMMAAASDTEIRVMGMGRKCPASSSGTPGISHASSSTAGSTVSRASTVPAMSADLIFTGWSPGTDVCLVRRVRPMTAATPAPARPQ